MPNNKNLEKVKALSQKVEKSASIIFFEYKGLSSNAMNDLRNKAKEVSSEVSVAKNTLVRIALGKLKALDEDLKEQTGVIFAYGDSIAPVKVLFDFAKKFSTLQLKGAFIEGNYFDKQKVLQIGALPSKNELLGRVLAGLNGPISNFVYALSAIATKKGVQD